MDKKAPAAKDILLGYLLRASKIGEVLIAFASFSPDDFIASKSLKAFVSSNLSCMYILIITRTKLIRNGILHPQERKLSSVVNVLTDMNAIFAKMTPTGAPA